MILIKCISAILIDITFFKAINTKQIIYKI